MVMETRIHEEKRVEKKEGGEHIKLESGYNSLVWNCLIRNDRVGVTEKVPRRD